MKRRLAGTVLCGTLVLALICPGTAWAENNQASQYSAEGNKAASPDPRPQEQGNALKQKVGEISSVGSQLDKAQSRVDAAEARAKEIGSQTKKVEGELAQRQQSVAESRAQYEERARAAYKGDGIKSVASLLGSLLGPGSRDHTGTQDGARAAQVLLDGRQSIEDYQNDQRYLSNTIRQLHQQRSAYEAAVRERKAQSEELSRREKDLETSIARIKSEEVQTTGGGIPRLQESERVRILRERPATGPSGIPPVQERKIARTDIVARPVDHLSKKRYRRLYKQAAKKYGFARDWYILAAVGWVESKDGQNMGPSSAGAMGPMQFLPSTWKAAGVDGNGDGVANIMDPRDAIPAAAAYLKEGGAPEDWYAALYTYNHADWYVREVLGVAEGYRQLAKDNTVGPYTRITAQNPTGSK